MHKMRDLKTIPFRQKINWWKFPNEIKPGWDHCYFSGLKKTANVVRFSQIAHSFFTFPDLEIFSNDTSNEVLLLILNFSMCHFVSMDIVRGVYDKVLVRLSSSGISQAHGACTKHWKWNLKAKYKLVFKKLSLSHRISSACKYTSKRELLQLNKILFLGCQLTF